MRTLFSIKLLSDVNVLIPFSSVFGGRITNEIIKEITLKTPIVIKVG